MKDILSSLQEDLESNNIFEFNILSLKEDGTLTIAGDFDLSYCHSVEIVFKKTTYISCPVCFSDAFFRIATESEKEVLSSKLYGNWNELIICIEADKNLYDVDKNSYDCSKKYFILAEEIEYKFGTVYYYKREKLEEGERIAEWIK
ncbi:hypothetical protein PV797_15035 [Clostridiaceae bacterium M8S5]|nr:hypothetical protein PV797_15035 [Clostridiaceae bacterium M8S5]